MKRAEGKNKEDFTLHPFIYSEKEEIVRKKILSSLGNKKARNYFLNLILDNKKFKGNYGFYLKKIY